MDLSDGLSIDLLRFATESGVEIAIDRPPPCFPGASQKQSLHGGEDYELVFALSPRIAVPSEAASVSLTQIGVVRDGEAGRVTFLGQPLHPGGWDHFRK
jgi:thiamine monophosphate kinase